MVQPWKGFGFIYGRARGLVVRLDSGAVAERQPGLDAATPLRQLQQPLPAGRLCASARRL
jgi:hypothetical protein